jgi:Protein of unknown function (DUF616)
VPDAAIISAVYGGYDVVKPAIPQQGIDAEWVLVTDDPSIPDGHLGWRVICDPRPGVAPIRAAKHPKFRPWEYTDAPMSVWIDGSCRVRSATFAADVLAYAHPLAQFVSPDRDCIYDEAAVSLTIPKYDGEPVTEQAECYRAAGHPEHWGMWCATVIARRHTDVVKALGEAWTAEVEHWSCEDQISQPWVLRNLGLTPATLPGYYRLNQWLTIEASGRHW